MQPNPLQQLRWLKCLMQHNSRMQLRWLKCLMQHNSRMQRRWLKCLMHRNSRMQLRYKRLHKTKEEQHNRHRTPNPRYHRTRNLPGSSFHLPYTSPPIRLLFSMMFALFAQWPMTEVDGLF